MTTNDSSHLFAETISSLDASKIPDKLHCPACDQFLFNGWRVPCCDQTVCEKCHSTISDRCPVCEHRPISQDLCKPNKALRNTAKAYLKTAEKKLADERAKAEAAETPHSANDPQVKGSSAGSQEILPEGVGASDVTPSLKELPYRDQPQPSIEASLSTEASSTTAQNEGEVFNPDEGLAQGRPEESGDAGHSRQDVSEVKGEESQDKAGQEPPTNIASDSTPNMMDVSMNANGFPNMMNMNMGYGNNMDYNQMMQYMAGNGMGNFANMMGMPNMGVNPMSQGLYGGFGGPGIGMAGMNGMNSMSGMNMGMNFHTGQGMYGAGWNDQNTNMWNGPQNNNPNAFSNGMGGDFGSNSGYGYSMSQQGNFHQHQYPNGDFQQGYYGRGYGRGRGRGRAGYGRGRGGYSQSAQGNYPTFHQPYEQQQYEIQNMQAQMSNNQANQTEPKEQIDSIEQPTNNEQLNQLNDDFAPGGQEEVQEALGEDHPSPGSKEEINTTEATAPETNDSVLPEPETVEDAKEDLQVTDQPEIIQPIPTLSPITYEDDHSTPEQAISAAVDQERSPSAMLPPSIPLGPAAHFADPARDYGFRGRGHGRFATRGRGFVHLANGQSISPVKPVPTPPLNAPTEPKGLGAGVVGAPTGPKAMRAPPVNNATRGRGGGFQIVGRASMTSQESVSRASEKSRSVTPINGPNEARSSSRSPSRRRSRHHRNHSSRRETDTEEDRDRHRERKHRRSTRETYDDDEMQDGENAETRSTTPDDARRSSHRSHKDRDEERDKDRHSSSNKHRSSHRSHRDRDPRQEDEDRSMDNYDEAKGRSSRELVESESRTSRHSHHGGRSNRYDGKDREERHRERRKRSRRERGEDEAEADEESRHRSRRHKIERHDDSVDGRRSERTSEAAAPTEPEKDIHTLEREARNRERMLKEQQRRENALNADRSGKRRGMAGGRRVSYKYEDETQATMVEQEREAARWR